MLRIIDSTKAENAYNSMLCHPLKVSGGIVLPRCTVLRDSQIELIVETAKNYNSKYIIVSDEKSLKESKLSTFVQENVLKCLTEEVEVVNRKYGYIINLETDAGNGLVSFLTRTISNIHTDYLIDLLTTPLILKKSLNLAILSMYFSMQIRLSLREMEDVVVASMLSDLALCKEPSVGFNNFDEEEFLIQYKKQKTSYSIIENDETLTVNTKRLVRYWKIVKEESIYHTEDGKIIFKDPTMEVIQLSNELLSYDCNMGSFKNIYNTYNYSIFQPLIVDLFKSAEINKNKLQQSKNNGWLRKIKNLITGKNVYLNTERK